MKRSITQKNSRSHNWIGRTDRDFLALGGETMTNEQIVIRIKAGIDVAENMLALWENNQGIIRGIVYQYWGEDKKDLMQEAYIGLDKAVDAYEPGREVKFMSYATYWIKQQVRRYIVANKPFNMPEYMQFLIQKDKKMTATFLREMKRKPTDQERMQYLKVSREQLEALDKALTMTIGSIDIPIGEKNSLHEIIGACDFVDEVLDSAVNEDLKATLWSMVDSLPEDAAAVIHGRFEKNLTYQQCGDSLGITRDRARSVEVKGLRKLRHPDNSNRLKPFLDGYEAVRGDAMRGTGVGRFANTWTSATERAALGIGSSFRE